MTGRIALASMLTMVTASMADAGGTLTTGVLFPGSNTVAVVCLATNVDAAKTIPSITVSVIGTNGAVVNSETCLNVAPGGFCSDSSFGPPVDSHCRIEFEGSKKSIRGSGSLIATSNNITALEAAR